VRAAFYDGRGGLELKTIPKPKLAPRGALVRLKACGIAISDVRAYRARLAPKLLHKLAGEIVEVANGARGVEPGDRVYINSFYHCGECVSCQRGFTNLCEKITYFNNGNQALSEYVSLPEESLRSGAATVVGSNVPFDDATHVGPLSNCVHTLQSVEFAPRDNATVLGAGPLGLLHVLLLRARGAGKIIVLDVDKSRAEKSREFGADYAVDAGLMDSVAEVHRLSNGGVDVVIVATGRPDAMLASIKMVRNRGRISFFGGLALEPGDTSFKLDPCPIHYKELKIVGDYGSLLDDYRVAATLITSKRISPSRLDTHHFDFDHIQNALEAEKDPRALRVMIHL
jgi:L-iditol 2-dehydrogenase